MAGKALTGSSMTMTRRDALRRGAAGLGLAASFATSFATIAKAQTQVPNWKTEMRELAPGVFAYIQGGGPGEMNQGVSNGGIIVGPDSILVIDSLGAPIQTKNFIAAIKKVAPNKPMSRMLISHHHGDHIMGLPFFPQPMEIVCHEYCRKEMLATTFPTPNWEKRANWAEGGEPRYIVPPTTTIDDRATYYYGNTEVQVLTIAPSHTYGDLAVYLPQHKILFASDIGFFYVAPFCHNAAPTKWMEHIDQVLSMNVDTIIPGHGPIGGKKNLAEMSEYLAVFKSEARKRYDAGMSPGKAAADIKLGRFDAWVGAQDRLVMNTVRYYHEFAGTLKPELDAEGNRLATIEFNAARGIKN